MAINLASSVWWAQFERPSSYISTTPSSFRTGNKSSTCMSCSFLTAITHSARSARLWEMAAVYTNIWRPSGNTQPRMPQNTSFWELWRRCPQSQKTKFSLQRRRRRAAMPQIVNTDLRTNAVLEALWKRSCLCQDPIHTAKITGRLLCSWCAKGSFRTKHPLEHAWHADEREDRQQIPPIMGN